MEDTQKPYWLLSFYHALLCGIIISLDQGSKWLALKFLSPSANLILGNTLILKHTTNYGCALSFLSQYGQGNQILLIVLAIPLILLLTILIFYRLRLQQSAIAETLIACGGISNLIDRFSRGGVIDFISFKLGPLEWPGTFNLADSSIVLGIIILILGLKEK